MSAAPPTSTRTIAADGVTGIADPAFDHLFGGDARAGIAALVAGGRVIVNGRPIPVRLPGGGYSATEMRLNGGRALWLTPDGSWSWNVHVLFHGAGLSYDEAVVDLVDGLTTLRGLTYELTSTGDEVTGLAITVFDIAFAETVTTTAASTTFTTVGGGDGSTDKPDPETLVFPHALVSGEPAAQSMLAYWEDPAGWHLRRTDSAKVTVRVTDVDGVVTGFADGVPIVDSRLTLEYSKEWNRPAQPLRGILWMQESDVPMIQWTVGAGITVGFSRGDDARRALRDGLATATAALENTAVSATGDGSDVAAGAPWVTAEYHDIFAGAVADARAVHADDAVSPAGCEGALFRLAQAFAAPGGDRFSLLNNRYFGATADGADYGGVGFVTFAAAHRGTGAAV